MGAYLIHPRLSQQVRATITLSSTLEGALSAQTAGSRRDRREARARAFCYRQKFDLFDLGPPLSIR